MSDNHDDRVPEVPVPRRPGERDGPPLALGPAPAPGRSPLRAGPPSDA